MQKVRCYECGKGYDYDEDGFCPRCGAFNLPPRQSGSTPVIRQEGISERGHAGSFLHKEYHTENRRRRATPLEQRPPVPKRKQAETRDLSNAKGIIGFLVFLLLFLFRFFF